MFITSVWLAGHIRTVWYTTEVYYKVCVWYVYYQCLIGNQDGILIYVSILLYFRKYE